MDLDLLSRLNDLSISSLKPKFLNKQPLSVGFDPKSFESFESHKFSSRILLNHKNMVAMNLKAGSLVKIMTNSNVIIENLFEIWPSILTSQNGTIFSSIISLLLEISFSTENIEKWIGIKKEDTINLLAVELSHSPILFAKKIRMKYYRKEDASHNDLIIRWLKSNIFARKFKGFVLYENVEVFFNIEVITSEYESDSLFRYDEIETTFDVIRETSKSTSSIIGGLDSQFNDIVKIAKSLFEPDSNQKKFNIKLPRGVLLHGPPGCGKTMLVRNISDYLNVPVFQIHPSDFSSSGYGDSEAKLLKLFDSAKSLSPCIFFMDEIDSLCPKRDSNQSASSQRITTLLLTLMDGCSNSNQTAKIFFIGATNMPSSLETALRRPGRFDREIEISPPSSADRFSILKIMLEHYPNAVTEIDLRIISDCTHGYVGSDLSLLCKESFINALKDKKEPVTVEFNHIRAAFSKIKPSAMREVFIEVPRIKWSDIGGQSVTKQKLIECVEWPIKYPERFKKLGVSPPKGILLFGPPGCSKTLLAKALASESGLNFLAIKGPEIFSKYIGDSEKKVKEIFKKARQASPSIIFFDEFDSIAGRSEGNEGTSSVTNRVMSQLLNEMDGLEPLVNVIIVAATNKPDLIDPALLRPGRFDRHIYISPPDYEGRLEIFKILMKKMPFHKDILPESFAGLTEGFSGAEITSLCQNAAIKALERDIASTEIDLKDLELCLSKFERQINSESLKIYEKFIQ